MKTFSFTNQPGISRGLAKEEDFKRELIAFGFDDVYICPHDHREGCFCRKPNTGMLMEAQKNYDLSLSNTIVIGDRWSDMVAAEKAGCMKILVRTGAGDSSLNNHADKLRNITLDYIANDLQDAIGWLYENNLISSKSEL
ncbi:HAD-IIIA family hydrolase [Thalassobacillus sp. B23F22_16]|uniref:HAD-IIIA family hydrolase n=1 Tax=Thalassobacillus sp. B23F22_16 TaxID=3459513 RepID=UPI00373E8BC7